MIPSPPVLFTHRFCHISNHLLFLFLSSSLLFSPLMSSFVPSFYLFTSFVLHNSLLSYPLYPLPLSFPYLTYPFLSLSSSRPVRHGNEFPRPWIMYWCMLREATRQHPKLHQRESRWCRKQCHDRKVGNVVII